MPLGTHPTARAKAKGRADPIRRAMHARTFEALPLDDLRSTPDHSNLEDKTRATSLVAEEPSRQQTPRQEDILVEQPTFEEPVAPRLPDNDVIMTQDIVASSPPVPQKPPPLPPPTSTSPLTFSTTPAFLSPPADFAQVPYALNEAPGFNGPPVHLFDYGIRAAINRRPDWHGVIDAIHSAANRDPEFKTLLAAKAQEQGATPEQEKNLRKKIRRLRKAWQTGQAAIQNSTFGALDAGTSPTLDSAEAHSPEKPSKSLETMATAAQAQVQQQSLSAAPTPPPAAQRSTPTLRLTFTKNRLQPPSTRPPRTHSPMSAASPLRQSTNLHEQITEDITRTVSPQQQAAESDSDLSSVNQDITDQDQSTFLK